MKPACAIFTNVAPLYSKPLWYKLASSNNVDYSFYSSKKGFSGIRTIEITESKYMNSDGKLDWLFLKNIYLRDIIVFQIGIISRCIRTNYDAYILYGEMNSLSNWIATFICKIRNKPVLIWGHGVYGNEKLIKKFVRKLYNKLADYHLVYGNRSRSLMIESGFSSLRIFTVYNSLDYFLHKKLYKNKNSWELQQLKNKLFPDKSELPVVIFIGRLTKEKKVGYLLEALEICKSRGNYYNCILVGDGIDADELRNLSESMGIQDSVLFYGSSYEESVNANLIMLSECCVSPGNVGLTAIHSLSFGTPVITHRNYFNQGPEVEAVIQNETGLLFEENSTQSLADAIDDLILNKKKIYMEARCIEQVDMYWNPVKQQEVFDKAVLSSIKSKYEGHKA